VPATYDPTTDAGWVRLLISDTDVDPEANAIFQDAEIDTFLTREGGNAKLAAAQALDTIASNEALVSKKIRTQDLATDGPAVAAELRARAKELRREVEEGDDGSGIDIVDFDPYAGYLGAGELSE